MTNSARHAPRTVPLVRLLVAVEVVLAGSAVVLLGFFTAVGLLFGLADDRDGHVDAGGSALIGTLGLFLLMLALLVLLLAFVRSSIVAAARLTRDPVRAGTTLVRLQWAVLAGLLLATPVTDGWLGFGPVNSPWAVLTELGCGGGTLLALRLMRSGPQYSGPVPAPRP